MSRTLAVWIAFVVISVGTYLFRASFLIAADRGTKVPERWRTPLRMIPPAVLAALVAPALLRPAQVFDPFGPRALAGLVALVVALVTRNILATIVVGLAAAVGFELLLG